MLRIFVAWVVLHLMASAALAASHALVVTNNRSLDLARPDLHYADDDGAKWTELLTDLGADVTLLSELDAATRALHPQLVDVGRPTRANLDAAARALAARLAADTAGPKVVYLVFAGHGDLAEGAGFLELADARFTAADLEALVAALPADRVHLVIDACNAWFMLHPRKPGASRFTRPSRELASDGLLGRLPHVGAILSTSAEAIAWEWSEIQSGLFSHVARSGLRGAADADRDGQITYRELEAWLAIAHQPIANEAYRPRIFARAPVAGGALVEARGAGRDVALELPRARRVTVRDARGLRVMDAHLEAGPSVTIRLPMGVSLEVDELGAGTERPTVVTIPLPAEAVSVGVEGEAREVGARGEGALLRRLFSAPFGAQALSQWAAAPPPEDAPYGVTQRDVERLGTIVRTSARIERNNRLTGGLVLGGMGAALTLGGFGLLSSESDDDVETVGWAVVGVGVLSLSFGVVTTLVTGDLEDIASEYDEADFSSEAARATTVGRFEARLAREAASYRSMRQLSGWFTVGLGALLAGSALLNVADGGFDFESGTGLGLGVMLASVGVWTATSARNPVEETWDLYRELREIPWTPGGSAPSRASSGASPVMRPVLAPIAGGLLLGLDGSF